MQETKFKDPFTGKVKVRQEIFEAEEEALLLEAMQTRLEQLEASSEQHKLVRRVPLKGKHAQKFLKSKGVRMPQRKDRKPRGRR